MSLALCLTTVTVMDQHRRQVNRSHAERVSVSVGPMGSLMENVVP